MLVWLILAIVVAVAGASLIMVSGGSGGRLIFGVMLLALAVVLLVFALSNGVGDADTDFAFYNLGK